MADNEKEKYFFEEDDNDYLTVQADDADQDAFSSEQDDDLSSYVANEDHGYSFGSDEDYMDFRPIDVSEPRAPRKEMEVIEEALKIRRREWIKNHKSYIFAAVGIVTVVLIAVLIVLIYKNNNPMTRLMRATAKNFSTSFDYTIEMTENGETVMSYDGTVDADCADRKLDAVYTADYNRYTYTAVVTADNDTATKGVLYDGEWRVSDCSENMQDFFDFYRSIRKNSFSGGSFLRFIEKTPDYSSKEMERFVKLVKNRLSTNSSIATVTSERVNGGKHYHYDIDLYELMDLIVSDGASVFYRATDYERFVAAFNENKTAIKNSDFDVDFEINSAGYLTSFEMKLETEGKTFGFTCKMSNFGKASVDIPEGFESASR